MTRTHTFEPSVYYVAIGAHEPALRIAPGDSVITSTVCSDGTDKSGAQATPGGNPQTGPFYIEGAEPGDVLAVRFDRIVPNRPRGRTATVLAANVVDPGFVHELPTDRGGGVWEVDTDAWTATLVEPETALGRLTIPLEPMMGCFGVAPPRGQAISCATSGTHGGNMDYRGFKEGVTVYLPVFVPGALFQLGDGHAVQGDGEIVGTGIEISMDVTFTAWIHRRQQPITWPRAENETYIMAAGNARPLDQALQHATTELLKWMTEDYNLDYRAASTLLGQCIRYDVGNVFDPAYTMVAKIEKSLLEPYRKSA
jgi:amidase